MTKGLLNGDAAGRLNPASGVTRAQAALMAYRAETSSLVVGQGFRASADHADKTRVVLDLSTAPSEVMPRLLEDGSLEVTIPWATVPAAGLSGGQLKEVGSVTATQGLPPPSVIVRVELRQYSSYQSSFSAPTQDRLRQPCGHRRVEGGDQPRGVPLVAIDPGHGGLDREP